MHQYKIEIYRYTPEGAVGDLETTRYADNPEQARLLCQEYRNQWQTIINPETGKEERTANKKFKVRLFLNAYKEQIDIDGFFALFEA